MTTGKKVAIACLGSLVLMILIGFLVLQWAKRKVISVVADTIQVEVVAEINKSPLPKDQKAAFVAAVDEILNNISSGEIDFTFTGQLKNKTKTADIIATAVKKAVSKLDIEEVQKGKIGTQIDRLKNAYSSEALSNQQVKDIADDLVNGQFGTMMAIWFMETKYIAGSGLSQEEKDAVHVTLGRLAKAMKSTKITGLEIDSLTDPYSVTDENGNKHIKENLTDGEIRELVKKVDTLLDEKDISKEPLKFDIGQELKEALDSAKVP